ncbi:MAG: hypothetical protein HYV35_04870 [Lentisphaerae bacterium]|nr:hypothetical protein [Lentisphaerota bacterium]
MKHAILSIGALLVSASLALAAAPGAVTKTASSERSQPAENDYDYEPPYIGLAAKLGTLGPGLEATIGIIEWLNLRAGANYFRLRHGGAVSDVDYNFDIKLAAAPLLADWHPFANEFRVSGGLIYNRNQVDLGATPNKNTKIGGIDFTPEQIGELSGSAQFKHFAPYFGLGYGNAVLDAEKTWGFVFDIGIIWQGSPEVELSANGGMADNPIFQTALAQEESDIQDDADVFRIYPVIAFGISYQF